MKIRLSWVAAAIVSLASAPAFAASSASASIGPLSFQLIDLNPLDGVTPWITFASTGYDNFIYVQAQRSDLTLSDYSELGGASPWATASLTASAGAAQAAASIAGTGVAHGSTLLASGSIGDFQAAAGNYALFNTAARAPYYTSNAFTLSANTLLVISGTANVTASAVGFLGFGANSAAANVELTVSGAGGGGGGYQIAADFISVSDSTYLGNESFNLATGRTLAVSFLNLTNGSLNGDLQLSVSAGGVSHANPVPEPETYALMLAGLALIGKLVRRRRG